MKNQSFKVIFTQIVRDHINKILIGGFLAVGILVVLSHYTSASTNQSIAVEPPPSADTFIPAGFTLVPIQLANNEAIGAIVSDFAIVDLFLSGELPGSRGRRVAQNVRLMRAPLNPQQFAVLVRENDIEHLFSNNSTFFAVIKNQKIKEQMAVDSPKTKAKASVSYYGGEKK